MKRLLLVLGVVLTIRALAQTPSANAIVAMGYLYPAPVSVAPGQLITVFLAGDVQGNIEAKVLNVNAPVLQVQAARACAPSPCSTTTAVTIQIPYELGPPCLFTNPACETLAVAIQATQLVVSVDGVATTPISLTPLADRVHILTACDTVVPGGGGIAPIDGYPCRPLVTDPDGTLVTAETPAIGSEVLIAYAVGLGLTNPVVATGQAASVATPTLNQFALDFNFRPNALASRPTGAGAYPASLLIPLYAGLAPGYAGLYQVNFVLPPTPAGLLPCSGTIQSNLTVSLAGLTSFDGAGICVSSGE